MVSSAALTQSLTSPTQSPAYKALTQHHTHPLTSDIATGLVSRRVIIIAASVNRGELWEQSDGIFKTRIRKHLDGKAAAKGEAAEAYYKDAFKPNRKLEEEALDYYQNHFFKTSASSSKRQGGSLFHRQ